MGNRAGIDLVKPHANVKVHITVYKTAKEASGAEIQIC